MFGLLGKKLGHSFSKPIHEYFSNKEYSLYEVDDLSTFFGEHKNLKGLNVTIPYKHEVIEYLDELSTEAKNIGAVNTIINRSGKLIGYNTDYYGLDKALSYHNISLNNQEVIVLGNGSTSRTIQYLCKQKNAKICRIFARNPRENEYHINDVENYKSSQIIFNATPVGMFPNNNDDIIVDLLKLPNLNSVIDVVYNPLRSKLLMEAKKHEIKGVNGLFMLISQALKSIELFHNITIKDHDIDKYYKKLLLRSTNIVLIGMPMSGKTYYTKLLSILYKKELIDIDEEIELSEGCSITNIFETQGEKYFRIIENEIIKKYSKLNNKAISCGGGVILNTNNMDLLKQNGIIIYLDAPLALLENCNPKGRPLLNDKNNLRKLFNARYPLYLQYADIIVKKDSYDEERILQEIEVKINEYFGT